MNNAKPQGGPLSPPLSNILLTDCDRELERRGHPFCRYAYDRNIYVACALAGRSATNGCGSWRNAGATHMHAAFPKPWVDPLGFVALLDTM